MSKSSKTLHKDFLKKLATINNTRLKFEEAFTKSIITPEDIRLAYAGLYLDLFTEFESLLEELFIGLMRGTVKHIDNTIKRKIKIYPISELETVITNKKGQEYLLWLPYKDNTIPRANMYLIAGKPFTSLEEIQKDKINSYHKIRNAIAHKSKKALNDFNQVINGLTLLPIEKTPSGFLRNVPNVATGKTQIEVISDELSAISFKLCS